MITTLKRINKSTSLFFYAMVSLASACSREQEVGRFQSPDHKVDAVLLTSSAGATSSLAYKVYLVPPGDAPVDGHEILIADKIQNLDVKWEKPGLLVLKCQSARIFNFKNFWQSKSVDNFKYIVDIKLIQEDGTNGDFKGPTLRNRGPKSASEHNIL